MASWPQRLAWRTPATTRIAFILAAAVLVAGCGQGHPTGAGSGGSATEPTAAASPTLHATSVPTPAHTASGQVSVTMSKSHYSTEDPLVATISNGLDQTIWISADRASCLGVVLQVQTPSGWQAAGSCSAARAPQPTTISAGDTLVKRLDYAQGADSGAGWPAGAYRVMLPYSLSQSAVSSSGATAYSPVFAIG